MPEFRNTLDEQLCFAVQSAALAFTQAYKPLLAPLKLTYPQYLVMLLLWEKDARSVKELGEPLFLDSGTLTPLLKRLQTLGYITRETDTRDERITRITLTAAGAALKKKAATIPAKLLCATGLDGAGAIKMRDSIKKLRAALRATDQGTCAAT